MSTTLLNLVLGEGFEPSASRLSAECYIHMSFPNIIGGSGGIRTHIHRAYETLALPYLRLNHCLVEVEGFEPVACQIKSLPHHHSATLPLNHLCSNLRKPC